jgi:DNA-binding MarR family transcriptional regulator
MQDPEISDRRVPSLMGAVFGSQRRIRRVLMAQGEAHGLARDEFDVLVLLALGARPCKAIAQQVMVPNPTLTRTLARMQERGLVTAQKGPRDGREKIMALTEEGQATYERVFHPHVALVERSTAHLDPSEQDELVRLLTKLADGFATEGASHG